MGSRPLKGLSRATAADRADYWLDRFDATDWADMTTEELSKGMQQVLQVISTLLPYHARYIYE